MADKYEELRRYLENRKTRRGLDYEEIHGFDRGDEKGAVLRASAIADLLADFDAAKSRIAELEKNAARYLWLRSQPNDCRAPRIDICAWTCDGDDNVNTGEGLRGEEADEAIDAAMVKETP